MTMMPPLLALDTSTDMLSVAVGRSVDGVWQEWRHTAAGGAQASAALIPAIQALMAQAGIGFEALQAIAFGAGPGAFTGLRTACAVAQGLAFGARMPAGQPGLQVLPVDSLLALAEEARHGNAPQGGPVRVMALLDARMDEVYAAAYAHDGRTWQACQPLQVCRPEALQLPPGWQDGPVLLAGNVFAAYGPRLPFAPALPRCVALPTASAMLRLAPELLARGLAVPPALAMPVYIRDKVAQTTAERAAARAAPTPTDAA